MKSFFNPNISRKGRILRGIAAALLLVGGLVALTKLLWLGIVLLLSGAFVAFEALRGWCLLRACGIKTKL